MTIDRPWSNPTTHETSGTDNLAHLVGVFGACGGRNAPIVWNSGLREVLGQGADYEPC